jgi:LAO/AO transport system kinase
VAVDPTSPISGGSVLGDRIRLQDLHSDPRVFIRSMASGGVTGGLAARTLDMVDLLDAFGFQTIFIESVGVGQGETDISRVVDTNVVVVVPGLGDEVQALKAGVLETGDVFVVNKSDRPEAGALQATLRGMLELGSHGEWDAPVIATSALRGDGIETLLEAIDEHRLWLKSSGEGDRQRKDRQIERVRMVAMQRIQEAMSAELLRESTREAIRDADGAQSAVEALLKRVCERLNRS